MYLTLSPIRSPNILLKLLDVYLRAIDSPHTDTGVLLTLWWPQAPLEVVANISCKKYVSCKGCGVLVW